MLFFSYTSYSYSLRLVAFEFDPKAHHILEYGSFLIIALRIKASIIYFQNHLNFLQLQLIYFNSFYLFPDNINNP